MHKFLTTHTIWFIIKHDPDNLVTNIFTKCSEDRMKADEVREQTKQEPEGSKALTWVQSPKKTGPYSFREYFFKILQWKIDKP